MLSPGVYGPAVSLAIPGTVPAAGNTLVRSPRGMTVDASTNDVYVAVQNFNQGTVSTRINNNERSSAVALHESSGTHPRLRSVPV